MSTTPLTPPPTVPPRAVTALWVLEEMPWASSAGILPAMAALGEELGVGSREHLDDGKKDSLCFLGEIVALFVARKHVEIHDPIVCYLDHFLGTVV